MKKQVLIMFVLALTLMSAKSIFAQSNCDDTPITPFLGIEYTYNVTIGDAPNPAGLYDGSGNYWWYVTQDENIFATLTTDAKIIPLASNYFVPSVPGDYNNQGCTTGNILLTWTQLGYENFLTNGSYYLVLRYTEQGAAMSCSANNFRVWEIKPLINLLLAIDAPTLNYCPADVSGAVVNTSTNPPTVQYTYGVDTVYATITPTLYTGEWRPYFAIPTGLAGDQQLTNVEWSYTADFATFYSCTADNTFGAGYRADDLATTEADGSVLLYVRYEITNNNYENLPGQDLSLAVDGQIEITDPATDDIISLTDCTPETDYGKQVSIHIYARPNVEEGDPVNAPFLVKNP